MKGISTEEQKTKVRPLFLFLIIICAILFLAFKPEAKSLFFVEKNYQQSILMTRPLIKGEVLNVTILDLHPEEKVRIHKCTNDVCSQAATAREWTLENINENNSVFYYPKKTSEHYIWLENTNRPQRKRATKIVESLVGENKITVTYSSGSKIEINLTPTNQTWINHLKERIDKHTVNLTEALKGLFTNHPQSTNPKHSKEDLQLVNIRLNNIPKASPQELQLLRSYLKIGKYHQLDEAIKNLNYKFQQDIAYEQKSTTLISSSVTSDPAYESYLNDFAKKNSSSYVPYLLRGIHFNYRGWKARGKKKAKDTENKQFLTMDDFFRKAQHDLNKALSIEPNLLHAYFFLINTSYHSSKKLTREFYEAGIKLRPESFTLRWWYQGRLLPRWGGSYIELDVIAENARPYITHNPLLPILSGRKHADMANIQRRKGNHQEAIRHARTAMKYGKHSLYLRELAHTYYKIGDHPRARINYEAASVHLPFDRTILDRKAFLYYKNWDYQKCLDTIEETLALRKADSFSYFYKGLCSKELEKHQDAINNFFMADLLDVEKELEGAALNHIKYYEQLGYKVNLKQKEKETDDI